jgi:A/G-specific adenine glycosylase
VPDLSAAPDLGRPTEDGPLTGCVALRAPGLHERLLAWGEGQRAELPWRHLRDPWAILVSEFMLQQTQVARVIDRFVTFVDVLPSPAACAAASRAEVLRLWDGLGYNRRAVNLHAAAVAVVDHHGGTVPHELPALLDLPGVGPYTARAVASLAYGVDVGVLDTNAARVLARAVSGRPMARGEAQDLADATVPAGRSREWNQAVMDLGATVCVKRSPRCRTCPVVRECSWADGGWAGPDPAEGTAGASAPQAPFEGSDRQGRGRMVRALRNGPVPLERIADVIGWPADPERADRVVNGLIADGLAVVTGGTLELPT